MGILLFDISFCYLEKIEFRSEFLGAVIFDYSYWKNFRVIENSGHFHSF